MHAFITSLRQRNNIKVIKLNLFFLNFTFFPKNISSIAFICAHLTWFRPKKRKYFQNSFFCQNIWAQLFWSLWFLFFSFFFHSTVKRIWPSIVRILSLPLTLKILFVFLSVCLPIFLFFFLFSCLSVFLSFCLSFFLS